MVAIAKDGKVEESSTLAVSEAERVIYTKDAMLVLHENKITALKHADAKDKSPTICSVHAKIDDFAFQSSDQKVFYVLTGGQITILQLSDASCTAIGRLALS